MDGYEKPERAGYKRAAVATKTGKGAAGELATYAKKRNFTNTPEPSGAKPVRATKRPRFVVQMHHASRLHYDFRLEADGVLKSWAIPKGPSFDTREKRLAMAVEDHPLDYRDFEGVIPKGNYGAGEVIVWDRGTYRLIEGESVTEQIDKGSLKFEMFGEKLRGSFALVHIKGRGGEENAWLLIKERDDAVDAAWKIEEHAESVKSGKTLDDIAADPTAPHWHSGLPSEHASSRELAAGKRAKTPASSRLVTPEDVARETVDDGEPTEPKSKPKSKSKTGTEATLVKKTAATGTHARAIPKIESPMLATAVDAPFDDLGWLFELKWDGYRALTTIAEDGSVSIASRNGNDFTEKFSELASLAVSFSQRPLVVDGEIVVIDDEGRPSFSLLQEKVDRFGRTSKKKANVTYVVFDLLYGDGRDLREEPLAARKELLESMLTGDGPVLLSKHVSNDGTALYEMARERGLEGIVAKKADSPYVSRRSRDWRKIKILSRQEFVIGGWTEGRRSRKHFGALLVGTYENGELVYAGSVGTGFDAKKLAAISARLEPLETKTPPFADAPKTETRAHWTDPTLVAEISFTEWTHENHLRHPVFVALRVDKDPREIAREIPEHARAKKR